MVFSIPKRRGDDPILLYFVTHYNITSIQIIWMIELFYFNKDTDLIITEILYLKTDRVLTFENQ